MKERHTIILHIHIQIDTHFENNLFSYAVNNFVFQAFWQYYSAFSSEGGKTF